MNRRTRAYGFVALAAVAGCTFASLDDIRVGNGPVQPPPPGVDEGGVPPGVVDAGEGGLPPADGGVGLANGLVGYWKLDGNPDDSSGNGTTLVVRSGAGSAPTYVAGKIGMALAPGIAQSVDCANCVWFTTPSNAHLTTDGDFTISMWARRSDSPQTNGWGYYALFYNGQILIDAQSATLGAPAYPSLNMLGSSSTPIATVQDISFDFRASANFEIWTHLIAFRSGSTIGVRFNGRPAVTTTFSGTTHGPDVFSLPEDVHGYPWQGAIDEVGKWNRALTSDEMDALWNGGAGRTLP